MDWTLPDRPRRLVTYGKSAHNRTARSQTLQAPKEPNSHGLTARRSRITTPPRNLRDAVKDNAPDSESLSQDSRPSPRSPKRRKLTPTDNDEEVTPARSPQQRARRVPAVKTTYGRRDTLRRSVSDIPDATHLAQSIDARLSLSPDRSFRPSTSNNRSLSLTQTDLGITPLRRRLVDALGSFDEHEDSSEASGSERDTPLHAIDPRKSKETTPVASDSQSPYNYDSQTSSTWNHKTQELIDASPQSGSPKVTYARQRSFLRNVDIHGDASADSTADFSASLLSMPLQPALQDDTEASQTESMGTISSIHELRRAGVNARFQGLVDSIFEDIEDRSASVRRSGFVTLCEKLLDEKFAQQFVEIGGFDRITKCTTPQADKISALLSVYSCALVLRLNHLPSIIWTSAWSKFITLAPTLLPLDDAVPKLVSQRGYSLSKVSQAAIRDIASQFGRLSGLDERESSTLSPRHLSLRCLYSTIRKVREKDIAGTIPEEVISQLVQILLELTQDATDRDTTTEKFVLIESIITILETYTTTSDITGKAQQDVLLPLTDSSHLLSSSSGGKTDPQDIQLLTLHLRLILNITNASASLCEHFATPEFIHGLMVIVLSNYDTSSEDFFIDEKKDSLDIVILALGALINLTEVSEAARRNIVVQKEGSQSLLEHLLAIFTRGLGSVSEADSVVQTHSNVAFGYLSILLCTVCLEPEAYTVVKGAMKGTGLAKILATVEEFLHYHRKVDEELQQSQSVKEFTSRLQRILNQIQRSARSI